MKLIVSICAALIATCAGSAAAVEVQKIPGGISIDGRPYTDLDGDITKAQIDTGSGKIAYFVKGAHTPQGDQFTVKSLDPQTNAASQIAELISNGNGWSVSLAGSQRQIQAQYVWACGDGVILSRAGLLARLHIDGQTEQFSLPPGWSVFQNQLGELCGTDYALLRGPVEHTGSLLHSLAGAPAYAFANIKAGTTVPIHPAERPNHGGPADLELRVGWVLSNGVAYAAYVGGDSDTAHIVNLATGKDRTIAERTLGIGSIRFVAGSNGSLALRVGMGMEDKIFDDVVAWLDSQS